MNQASSTPAPEPERRKIPLTRWLSTYFRLFAVQGSWNYETMLGTGIAFSAEPLTGLLPHDKQAATRARQTQYFNAHPYLAGVAVGALARAELDGADPVRIERFRVALTGPLGSVGDQLIWAAWLPFCAIVSLCAYGFGAGPLFTALLFLILYNLGHFALRAWGLHVGLTRGLQVAPALGAEFLRKAPRVISRLAALTAGITIPFVMYRLMDGDMSHIVGIGAGALLFSPLLILFQGKAHGWQIATVVLALFALFAVVG